MLRIASILLTSFALVVSGAFARAQDQPGFQNALLDHLVGKWLLKGEVQDRKVVHDIEAKWTLGHQYLFIHEVSHELKKDGDPVYDANVFVGWNPKTSECVCIWLDVFGGITPTSLGRGKPKGDEIPFVFPAPDGTFQTTFTYLPDSDGWKWKMDGDHNGVLNPFARMTLDRVK